MVNELNKIKRRFLEISYKHKLLHVSSGLSCIETLYNIYSLKRENSPVILSMGHAAVALYTIIEHFYPNINASNLVLKHGVHPNRDVENKIDCSTGSLGAGITIAAGMALADRVRPVYCIISDGECAEGSVWEALKFVYEKKLYNLHIYVIINGYTGIDTIDTRYLINRLQAFHPNINIVRVNDKDSLPFLKGIQGHYHVMSDEDYNTAMNILEDTK